MPSVTGEGVDMFCFRSLVSPSLRCRFHSGFPVLRSTAQRSRLPFSATFKKMRSPQMIGVEPDHAGSGSFHVMFSVVDHFTGRLVSALIPLAEGPRHCGQFSARKALSARTDNGSNWSTHL